MRVSPQVLNHLFWAAKRPLGIYDPVFGEQSVHQRSINAS